MKEDTYFLDQSVLPTIENSTLFYPCSGFDVFDPIELFAPHVTEFWFVDKAYFSSGHQNTRHYGFDLPANHQLPLLVDYSGYDLLGWKIIGPPDWGGNPDIEPCISEENYRHIQSGKTIKINRRRGYGLSALKKEVETIGVFFYRGDSCGEGGSGGPWLDQKRLKDVFDKLIDGGLLVLDGSDGSPYRRGDGIYEAFWKNRFLRGRDPIEIVEMKSPFQDKSHRLFTCVGYIGRGTFVWRVEKCTGYLNLPLNLKGDNSAVLNDEWLDELIAWADENEIDEEILPRNKEAILNLTKLIFSYCELKTLPESIGNLRNLEKLFLYRTELSQLPESIGNLTNLTSLSLWDNKLSTLPESFGNLTNLTYLDLRVNQLSTLPESFGNLTNLTELNLEENQLSTLPESFGNLTNLEELDLRGNTVLLQKTDLPKSVQDLIDEKGVSKYTLAKKAILDLRGWDLRNKKLRTLPESIGDFINLEHLHLDNNQLDTLPESIGNLTKLTSLYLRGNQLKTLPESFANLMKLTKFTRLDLRGNHLKTLPEWIGNLTNLTSLDVSNNQLSTLPESFGNLTNLKWLHLSGNVLRKKSDLPKSVQDLIDKNGLKCFEENEDEDDCEG